MRNYKIVCSDLDGTLLDSRSQISAENLQAIRELAEKGVHFVPSTGRTYSELPPEIRQADSIRYVIHSNGAVVLDRKTGKRILTCIPDETSRKIMDILTRYETHITYRNGGESYVDGAFADERFFRYYNVSPEHCAVVMEYTVWLDDFANAARNAKDTEVFSAFFHSLEEREACREAIKALGGLRIVEAAPYNLEIINADAGKGNALYALADMLDIDRDDTISIGDSDNDETIIRAAGLGLAVSNARESLKEAADAIICSNDEHAVKYVLERYF